MANKADKDNGDTVKETTYSVNELVAGAYATFKTKPEVVMAALKSMGLKEATIEDTKKAVETFLKKEVSN
jgi:hypothetical protein